MQLPDIALKSRRPPCSVCGLLKRYFINLVALKAGADKVALGHHLDDLSTYVMKSILMRDYDALKKLGPESSPIEGMGVSRVRPLYLTSERENLAYVLLKGIPFVKNRCPFFSSKVINTEIRNFLSNLDLRHPGTKINFMKGIARDLIPSLPQKIEKVIPCKYCGMPSRDGVCGFCRLTKRLLGSPKGPEASSYVEELIKSPKMSSS